MSSEAKAESVEAETQGSSAYIDSWSNADGDGNWPGREDHPPLHLPQYVSCYDENRQSNYLYHSFTGECIYVDNDAADASGVNRNFSCWTRPNEVYSSISEMRVGESEVRAMFRMHDSLVGKEGSGGRRVFKDEEDACVVIQSFVRQVRDSKKYRDKIRMMFSKYYDEDNFLFFFVNERTGESQWHRPIGLGASAENDLPEMDFSSALTLQQQEEEGKEEGAIEEYKENEDPQGYDQVANLENQLGFQISAVKHPPFKFLAGPYCKRTKGKPGRNVTRALGNRKLKDSHEVLDKHGRKAFANPKEMDLDVELYGPDVSALDGLVIREVPAEPYMLMRASYERGAMSILDTMERYKENRHVILFGILSLGKMAIVETADGVASAESERAMDVIMKVCEDWKENMAILSASLGALASLSDNYANRIMMNEKKWMPLVVKLMKMVETETSEVYIRFSDGVKKVTMTSVSRHSRELAINGSKFLFNMSCDEANREYVADSGLPLVTYVMKFCSEDPTVQHYGCLALYNFVYRNEPAHYQANEEGILDLLAEVLSNFGGDDNLRKACKRTIAAMEPEGWRGNLGVKFDDSKM